MSYVFSRDSKNVFAIIKIRRNWNGYNYLTIFFPSNTALFLKPRFSWGLSVISCLCYLFFTFKGESNSICRLQLLSICQMGVYLQGECLFLISPIRTKVTLSLSSESFWTSWLWCVHALFLVQCWVPCWDFSSHQRSWGSFGDKPCKTTTLICWRLMESWALYCVLLVPVPAEVNQLLPCHLWIWGSLAPNVGRTWESSNPWAGWHFHTLSMHIVLACKCSCSILSAAYHSILGKVRAVLEMTQLQKVSALLLLPLQSCSWL